MAHPKTALVVDDSRVSRLIAHQCILSKQAGWSVEEADSGEAALQKAALRAPALILLDVNMPGMGGLAAAVQLRELCPSTHICLLTANVQNATRERAAEIGVAFMEKPISEARIHQLLTTLEA